MMSFNKRYCFEDFINELDYFVKVNLDTYLDQMNTDKTDLVLKKPVRQARVETFVITVADATLYSITIFGRTYSFTSGIGATFADINAGLAAAVTADVSAVVTPSIVGDDLLLTAKVPGITFVATTTVNLVGTETQPNAEAYYFQSFDATEAPYEVFVYYGEVGTASQNNGPDVMKQYNLQFAIIMANTNELQFAVGKRLQRYRECLFQMFEQGWNNVNKRLKIEVSGISPFPFSVTNRNATHVGIGVNLEIQIP